MRLRLILFTLVAAAVLVPVATAEGPPQPPKERPAPGTFPADAVQRLAAEVCMRVKVENCVEKATELAQAALEACRASATPAMCVKEAVVRGLGTATGGEVVEDVAVNLCTRAQAKFPVRFGEHFDSVDACVAALNDAAAECPTATPRYGCLMSVLAKTLNGAAAPEKGEKGEKGEKAEKGEDGERPHPAVTPEGLARSLERTLCKQAVLRGKRCSAAVRAKARMIAARCASAEDPKACVREALKQTGRKP